MPLEISSAALHDAEEGPFELDDLNLPVILEPQASLSVGVIFKQAVASFMHQCTLLLTTNASDPAVGLPLFSYTGQLHYLVEGSRGREALSFGDIPVDAPSSVLLHFRNENPVRVSLLAMASPLREVTYKLESLTDTAALFDVGQYGKLFADHHRLPKVAVDDGAFSADLKTEKVRGGDISPIFCIK